MAIYSDDFTGHLNVICGVNSEFLTLDLEICFVTSKPYGVNIPWLYSTPVLNFEIDMLTGCTYCLVLP